jgi:DNA repair protein RadD
MRLRPYQNAAVQSVFDWFGTDDGNPLIVMPTGTGKALTIADFIRRALHAYPQTRVLMLTHVRELIRQNAETMIRIWPDAPLGICSSGLGRKDFSSQIIFAGIQSIHRYADRLPPVDLVIVDECHLIPTKDNTMYGRFLADLRRVNPYVKIVGFTATHYRLDSGYLHTGEDALFGGVSYEYGIRDAINDGWLCEPIPQHMATTLDAGNVARRGGDFVPGELERAVDVDPITQAICDEIIKYGERRRSWLVFAAGVKHAHHICEAMQARGIVSAVVDGGTDTGVRDTTIAAFKRGEIRALVGARIFTTGFDAPNIDLIADAHPTESTSLHVQKIGRGTRIHPSTYFDGFNEATADHRKAAIAASVKPNCLYLDFAGNAGRHGPLDQLVIKEPGKGGGGEAPVKECPDCFAQIHASIRSCPYCGHEFPPPEPKVLATPKSDALLSSQIAPQWVAVSDVSYFKHTKPGVPPSLRVEYRCGLSLYREWVCLEHTGFARQKACQWWQARAGTAVPNEVDEAIKRLDEIRKPSRIQVRKNGKFFEVVAADYAALEVVDEL